jgi:hypothetical protein
VGTANNHDLLQLLLFDPRHNGLEVVSPQEMVPEDVFVLGYCGEGLELLVWEGLSASIREDYSF